MMSSAGAARDGLMDARRLFRDAQDVKDSRDIPVSATSYGNAEFSRDVIERFPELREDLQSDENLLRCQIGTLAAAVISSLRSGDTYLPLRICAFLEEALRRPDASSEIRKAVALSFVEAQELRRTPTGRLLLRSMPQSVRQIILEHEAEIGEW